MSTSAAKRPIDQALTELAALVAHHGVQAALIGRCALQLNGLPCRYEEVVFAVSAAIDLPDGAESVWPGGWRIRDVCGLPVRCVSRNDHYEALYRAAITEATMVVGVPLPVAPVATVCATLMAERDESDISALIDLIAAGALEIESLRDVVRQRLGVYALDDFEAMVQEAEWRAMRRRYESGEETH